MRILLWHVHGSWTTAFVEGDHEYVVPVLPDRSADGRGRARTWEWPSSVLELSPQELGDTDLDLVLLQRPHELEQLCEEWTGRRPGRDIATIYVEHNAPQGRIAQMAHPARDRDDLTVVHVTHFNDLFWDCGSTRTRVIEHGILDPGYRYTGEIERAAVAINEPHRRWRVTGTDLLERFEDGGVPLDVFGMAGEPIARPGRGIYDLPQHELHDAMARRRLYLHPIRWTSLGLSLLEAMHLGMPVVALATTEAIRAVPPQAGALSTNVGELVAAATRLLADAEAASAAGLAARRAALERYGIERFLADWDELMEEVVDRARSTRVGAR